MLRNLAVYLLLSLSMVTILADEAMPLLEFIKDGEVIESRAMTQEEFAAYIQLKSIEQKINKLQDPLDEFQQALNIETQLVEEEVKKMEAKLKEIRIESLADLSQLSALGEIDMTKVEAMLEQMQPMLDEVTDMTDEISSSTNNFKDVIMKNYKESDIDQIKIIDGKDDKITFGRNKTFLNL